MRERIIIVFIALAIGLLVTTLIFFLYQQTKSIPNTSTNTKTSEKIKPTSTPRGVLLSIDTPNDQTLIDRRSIQVKGKTDPGNTIVVSSNLEDQVVKPSADGRFAVTITIGAGSNKLVTRAITPTGEEAIDTRVITYSTEEF